MVLFIILTEHPIAHKLVFWLLYYKLNIVHENKFCAEIVRHPKAVLLPRIYLFNFAFFPIRTFPTYFRRVYPKQNRCFIKQNTFDNFFVVLAEKSRGSGFLADKEKNWVNNIDSIIIILDRVFAPKILITRF